MGKLIVLSLDESEKIIYDKIMKIVGESDICVDKTLLKEQEPMRIGEFCMYWIFIKAAFFLKNKFITSSGMGSISGMTATSLPISAAFERKLKMTLAGLSISRLYEGLVIE